MIESIAVPMFVIGLISSIVTEVLKLFPVLSKSDERKKAVAFVVALVISFGYIWTTPDYHGLNSVALILGAISCSFTVYKSVIQVILKPKAEEVKAQ